METLAQVFMGCTVYDVQGPCPHQLGPDIQPLVRLGLNSYFSGSKVHFFPKSEFLSMQILLSYCWQHGAALAQAAAA